MNYGETMGEPGSAVHSTIRHLDGSMDGYMQTVVEGDAGLSRGYLNIPVDPQASREYEKSAWFATLAELGVLTPDQMKQAKEMPSFGLLRTMVDIEGLSR